MWMMQMQGGTRYCLPLVAMVEIMRSSPSRVLIQAQLASLSGVSKWECLAQVVLDQGAVCVCTITGAMGAVLLQEQAAYEALGHGGDLDWEVVSTPVSALPSGHLRTRSVTDASGTPEIPEIPEIPEMPAIQGAPWSIPTLRVTPLPRALLASLPHAFRIALVLVDGKRSVAEIAQLLHKTPHDIQQLFTSLQNIVRI